MPWRETSPMNERIRFVADFQHGLLSMTELCERYYISRKTGYKWLDRFEEEGPGGLQERSRRPLHCPHKTPEHIEEEIVQARLRHPSWGPKKLLALLKRRHCEWKWPGISTVADILKRNGLITKSRRRPRQGHPGKPDTPMDRANAVWTTDFKGEFKTLDGFYCYPLTVVDGYSRFLLGCQGLHSTSYDSSKPVFIRLFKEYGLPDLMRSDNGVPFATTAIARLSKLSVWWIRLGIFPELIEPAHPQQNGRHERMHRTLKAETTRPPAANLRAQQYRFNTFRQEFNYLRPHEAIDLKAPASLYTPSNKPYPAKLPAPEYPDHFEVRYVSANGGIRWKSRWVNVSQTLISQNVGLEEIDDGIWSVYFGPIELGRLDERDFRIEDILGRKSRRKLGSSTG
jgi:putative transposase